VRAETPGSGGRLGVGMRRDVGTVLEGGSPAYVDALNEVVIAIMVEKRECVQDLEAILSVPGIDMVQFGSSDYSMSLGLTGQRSHPDVVKAERWTIETALRIRPERSGPSAHQGGGDTSSGSSLCAHGRMRVPDGKVYHRFDF
jgi:4-hydroxy-2-oxoheptanedioate aldolase